MQDSKPKAPQTNECTELKNIKYKSMMLKNNQKRGDAAMQMLHNTSATNSITHIENYLERERAHNISEPWGKLDKTVKITKINVFAKTYAIEHGLSDVDCASLVVYLIACIDHKKIVKTKDVIYDKISGNIVSIPVLTHITVGDTMTATSSSTKFTLRRCDKRQSTLKSLPISKQKPVVILSSTHGPSDPSAC